MKAGIMKSSRSPATSSEVAQKGAGVKVWRGAVENEQLDVGYTGGVSERRVWWQKDLSKY